MGWALDSGGAPTAAAGLGAETGLRPPVWGPPSGTMSSCGFGGRGFSGNLWDLVLSLERQACGWSLIPLQLQIHLRNQRWLQPTCVGGARRAGREVKAAPGPACAFSSSAPSTGGCRVAPTPAPVPLAAPQQDEEATQVLPGASSQPGLFFPSPVMGLSVFSSVAQLCPTLCKPVDCSTPGLPVHHQLPEFTQTDVH